MLINISLVFNCRWFQIHNNLLTHLMNVVDEVISDTMKPCVVWKSGQVQGTSSKNTIYNLEGTESRTSIERMVMSKLNLRKIWIPCLSRIPNEVTKQVSWRAVCDLSLSIRLRMICITHVEACTNIFQSDCQMIQELWITIRNYRSR